MANEMFQQEYDLSALTMVRPQGHAFSMYVTPRYRQHYEGQEYERFTARFLARVLKRCSLFIDVGANYGFYTLLAGTDHPQLEILALEPVAETFEVLRRNVQAAGLSHVRLEQLAAADQDGSASFCISAAADNCGFSPHPAAPVLRQTQVRTARLDSLLKEHKPVAALVKIDVEGHELTVLRGMRETFARFDDLSVVLELNPKMLQAAGHTPEELFRELDGLGFAMFLLDDARRRPCRLTVQSNWRACLAQLDYANLYCVRKPAALSVCLFSHTAQLAGAEQSLLQLIKELVGNHGALCSVVVPGEGPLTRALEEAGAACLPAEYSWWGASPPNAPPAEGLPALQSEVNTLVRGLLPQIAQVDPDVLWTQTLVIPWGAVVASLLGKPHVWSVCEYGELDHGIRFFASFSRVLQDILSSSAVVYTCGQAVMETLFPEGNGQCQRHVLYRHLEAPDSDESPAATGLFKREGAIRLGVFATIQEGKGQEDAIRAMAELVTEGRNVELLLAGYAAPAQHQRVEALIAQHGLQEHVRLSGFLLDRVAAMRETDIVVICSRREAFGLVGLEGMQLGKPVVYAAAGGLLEYMVDGRTGLAYPPGDARALAAKIRKLLNEPTLMAALGAAGRAYVQERFTAEAYGGEVYRRLLALRNESQMARPAPALLQPLMLEALLRLVRDVDTARISLQERNIECSELRGAFRDRTAEAEQLRQELNQFRAKFRFFIGVDKFFARQKRSVKKRLAEAQDLLLRALVQLRCTPGLRRLRRERKLIRNSQIFDEPWYLKRYGHLVSAKTDPILHYLRRGALQNCDPNQLFDTAWYCEQNPQAAAGQFNPLVHYLQTGWRQGCDPSSHFDGRLYLEANPDIAAAGMEPLTHYLRFGSKEGRALEPGTAHVFSPQPEPAGDWPAPDVRLIAFYLPQFHRIPENDAWWGEGFTEWTNVRRGRPQFAGHYQPHVPHPALGYYDLTDESVLERQARMARRFGIHGFCFHHYWFGGKRLLHTPVEKMLRTGKPDFPFCLCWANENWTRRWDGAEKEILLAQRHSPEDDEQFIRDLLPFLRDRRYIRVDGRPLLMVYRPSLLPDAAATFRCWRELCRGEGVGELFLVGAQTFDFTDPRPLGLEAAVEFPPHNTHVDPLRHDARQTNRDFQGLVYDYQAVQWNLVARRVRDYRLIRGLMPSWDNTARRREHGTIFVNASPRDYYLWLRHLVRETRARFKSEERLVFINAWNEWAEGCHLEPDQRHGFAWLNATRRALLPAGYQASAKPSGITPPIQHRETEAPVLVIGHDACRAGAQHALLSLLRQWQQTRPFPFRLLLVQGGVLQEEFESLCPTLLLANYAEPSARKAKLEEFLQPRPRVIFSNTVVNGLLLEELRPLGCPVVTHVHELEQSIRRWAPGEIMEATLRCSDHFIAASEPVAQNLQARHGVESGKISVLNSFIETAYVPGVDLQDIRMELGLAPGQVLVLGCGTADWRKGPDLFIEIAARACPLNPALRFFWVGAVTPEQQHILEAQLDSQRVRGQVYFLGERPEPRAFFGLGHIFLLSSREDPFPLVALEAAAAGLPIVCFQSAGGMPDFVGEECGQVVPFEDTAAAAAAIIRLAADERLRNQLGAQAKAKVAERHSAPAAARRIAKLLVEVGLESATVAPAMNGEPLVTIVVPNYNHAAFLPERLASIQKQGLEKVELLLLDDGSDDGSTALLEGFAQREPAARFVRNGANSGSAYKQWRKALAMARGKYIWIAESDDSAEPELLRTLVQKLESNPALALAYAQSRMIGEQGQDLGLPLDWTEDICPGRWREDFEADGLNEIRQALSVKNTIPNASAVLFRNFPGIEQLVDDTMRLCADWLFWVRLCSRGRVSFTARPLNLWRQNSSHSRTEPPGVLELKEGQVVLAAAAELAGAGAAQRAQWLAAFEQKCEHWRGRSENSELVAK